MGARSGQLLEHMETCSCKTTGAAADNLKKLSGDDYQPGETLQKLYKNFTKTLQLFERPVSTSFTVCADPASLVVVNSSL